VANTHPTQRQINASLNEKAETERQRNKQRQREKKKNNKKSKKEEIKDPNAKKAYKKVQQEIGAVLGDPTIPKQLPNVFVAQPKKSKKKKAPKRSNSLDPAETSPDSMEMRDILQPKHAGQMNGLGYLETDDSEHDSGINPDPAEKGDPQALEEARQRMHALLDDAFALIAPHRNDDVQEESPKGPHHTPIIVNNVMKSEVPSHQFNPYHAADQILKIQDPYPPGVVDTSPEAVRRPKSSYHPHQVPSQAGHVRPSSIADYQYANPAFAASAKNSPVVLGTRVLPNSHLNLKTAKQVKRKVSYATFIGVG
jgi:hypothetical protein